eukprot:jgi/Ulvmu1/11003/UM007_0183.1
MCTSPCATHWSDDLSNLRFLENPGSGTSLIMRAAPIMKAALEAAVIELPSSGMCAVDTLEAQACNPGLPTIVPCKAPVTPNVETQIKLINVVGQTSVCHTLVVCPSVQVEWQGSQAG